MADGTIIFNTALDNKELEKQLAKTRKEIAKLEQSVYVQRGKKSPLVQQAQELEQKTKAARAEVQRYGAAWQAGTIGADKDQAAASTRVRQLETQYAKIVGQIDRIDKKLLPAQARLDEMQVSAGGIEQQLAQTGTSIKKMDGATKKANRSAQRFALRLREVVRSALVFTLITQALAKFREWMGKVVRSNTDATASVARLKGALLTLAQPLVDVIIPAFTIFVNVLTQIINSLAGVMAVLFGTTAEASKEAAENLFNETKALDATGDAAKKAGKSLARFDEINKLSDPSGEDKSSGTAPDFSAGETNWLSNILGDAADWVLTALMLGGIGLIAIGSCMGKLSLILAGLILLGAGLVIGGETGSLRHWVDVLGLNSVQEFVVIAILLGGIAIVAIGAAVGNILMVIAGLALIGAVVLYSSNSGMMRDWVETLGLSRAATYITAALLIGGMALVVIGAIAKDYLMVIAGLGLLAAGVYVGQESGAFQSWWDALQLSAAVGWVTAGLLIAGMAMIVFGVLMRNLAVVLAGIGLISAGVVVGSETGTFTNWWDALQLPQAQNWITAALIIGGIALILFGIFLKNIPMFMGGLAMIFAGVKYGEETGTFDRWWDALGLPHADNWVTAALLIGGIALVVFGILSKNILMVVGGLTLLAVGAVYGSATGTFHNWWDALGLPQVAGWVSTALLLAGIALVAIGAMTLNPMLVLTGLGLLGGGIAMKAFGSQKVSSAMPAAASLPTLASYEVPRLAQGAVIPANREFLAVLGDQKSGTNIEAPLSTIEQAVENVMNRRGYGGGGEMTLVLDGDLAALARVFRPYMLKEGRRVGVKLTGG